MSRRGVEDLIGVFQGTLKGGFNYARQGTPTTAALEAKITGLEQGFEWADINTRLQQFKNLVSFDIELI